MPEKNWIDEAFEKARQTLDRATPIADRINEFLDSETPRIMDEWRKVVGEESYFAFLKMIAQNDHLIDAIGDMTKCFTAAGYLLALQDMGHGMEV